MSEYEGRVVGRFVPIDFVHRSRDARVAVVSWRALNPRVSRCGIFHFEDTLTEVDAADVIAPKVSRVDPRWLQRVTKVAKRFDVPLDAVRPNRDAPLDREYDLLLVSCENMGDLNHMGPLEPWLERARKSVCYLGELWAKETPPRGSTQAARLRMFDHILLTNYGTIDTLAREIEMPVSYLPPAVDSLFFCPHPAPPERCIDIYNMGRRSESTHEAIKAFADERQLFYLHDTRIGNTLANPKEHRRMLAHLLARTKYFLTYPGKVDLAESTKGQEDIGARYFEGAAGGVVMVGKAPQTPVFSEYFDYEDVVIEMPYGSRDIASVYDALESEPEAVAAIRRRNLVHSLRRHDWAYHWRDVLGRLGMEPLPRLGERVTRLHALADELATPNLASTLSLPYDEA
jgi:hypothetical protein